jgi:hypothetical protein
MNDLDIINLINHRSDKQDTILFELTNNMHSINTTLQLQHLSLDTHIKRTDLLETSVNILREEHTRTKQSIKVVTTIISIISVIVGILVSYKQLTGK